MQNNASNLYIITSDGITRPLGDAIVDKLVIEENEIIEPMPSSWGRLPELSFSIQLTAKSFYELIGAIKEYQETKAYIRGYRFKSGVKPKIHNRTKKKQRLTRLQRRAKRQRR